MFIQKFDCVSCCCAERLQHERQEALENMGISVQASGIMVEKNKYYLVNLNADPSLNELLVYYLKDRTLVGAKVIIFYLWRTFKTRKKWTFLALVNIQFTLHSIIKEQKIIIYCVSLKYYKNAYKTVRPDSKTTFCKYANQK